MSAAWLALAVSGCAGAAPVASPSSDDPAALVVRTESGEPATLEALDASLAAASLVCVGERHDVDDDHRVEEAVVRRALRAPGTVALALEMVEQDRQPVLDAYAGGALDDAALDEALGFEARWGLPLAPYLPSLRAVVDAGGRIVAANAVREVVRAVAREGEAAARARFGDAVPPLVVDPDYAAFVGAALAGHDGMPEDAIARFVHAQQVWDATMAQQVRTALDAGATRVVLFAGTMHCGYGLGVPAAAARLGVGASLVLLPHGAELPQVDGRPASDYRLARPGR